MSVRHVVTTACLLLSVAAAPLTRQSSEPPEKFTAFAVSTGGPRTAGVATTVDIRIDRWSTAEETQRLLTMLKEKGADALLDVLRDLKPVGSINTPGNLAYDLRYAYQAPTEDGGRRIFLATDRPISFWEAVNRPRVSDYPFTFIELRVDASGNGEGKLAVATRIEASKDGKVIQLENYDVQPIHLNQVRRQSN